MKRLWRGLAIGSVSLPVLLVASCVADRASFASDRRQREILNDYYPDVDCRDAKFELKERSETLQDWYYVVRISGSERCVTSLRRSLARRGFVYRRDLEPFALAIPGRSTEDELVSFDFDREPGAVYWARDKT